tara:strand:+ start:15927 stop:16538 length:612 start_codon:yes stop_codon:yes gene_type:complete
MSNLLVSYTPFKATAINEVKGGRKGIMEVSGVMQRAGAKNQNGRVYDRAILEREVQGYMENFVKVGNAYGELDHPESPIVSLRNASHVVTELWWEGDDLMGTMALLDTPSGNIVKNIIQAGWTIGVSSRGTGSVAQTNEGHLAVQSDFELVCWDFVSNPSTHGAFMNPMNLSEGALKQQLDKYQTVNNIIREIICATTCSCSL